MEEILGKSMVKSLRVSKIENSLSLWCHTDSYTDQIELEVTIRYIWTGDTGNTLNSKPEIGGVLTNFLSKLS